jgi:hypothetical protein
MEEIIFHQKLAEEIAKDSVIKELLRRKAEYLSKIPYKGILRHGTFYWEPDLSKEAHLLELQRKDGNKK